MDKWELIKSLQEAGFPVDNGNGAVFLHSSDAGVQERFLERLYQSGYHGSFGYEGGSVYVGELEKRLFYPDGDAE